jgi:hypothetical protein
MNSSSLTQKFSAFYVIRNLMTVCTTNKFLSLCRVRWIESMNSHPIPLRPLSMLSSSKSLILPNKAFCSHFPTKIPYTFLVFPTRVTCHAHLIFLHSNIRIISDLVRSINLKTFFMQIS